MYEIEAVASKFSISMLKTSCNYMFVQEFTGLFLWNFTRRYCNLVYKLCMLVFSNFQMIRQFAQIQAVNTMVLAYKEDREFVKECLQYLHKRVVYEKNRKRVCLPFWVFSTWNNNSTYHHIMNYSSLNRVQYILFYWFRSI